MIRRLAVIAVATLALLTVAASASAEPLECILKPHWC